MTQAFLDSFYLQYLTPLNHPLFQKCRLVAMVDPRDYQRLVGKRHGINKLPDDQSIWGLVHSDTERLVSILHLTKIHDCMLGAPPGPHHILQWSYAFTLDEAPYIRQGLSSVLRLVSLLWANSLGCDYINSVPLPGSQSNALLEGFGFTRYYDRQFDLDYYIREISDKEQVIEYVKDRLKKYQH